MSLSNGFRVSNMGAGLGVDFERAEIFFKSITANTALNLTNITETKQIRIVVTNTSAAEVTLSFTFPGFTAYNLTDVMVRVRAGRTQIYEIVSDTTTNKIAFLAPLKLDAIYAP